MKELPISVEDGAASRASEAVMEGYDASYLELAMRRGLPLATLDLRLAEAAGRAGVALVE